MTPEKNDREKTSKGNYRLPFLITLGRNIRTKRMDREIQQKTLAVDCNVSNAAISKLEHGIAMPGLESLNRILTRLETTLDEMIYGENCLKCTRCGVAMTLKKNCTQRELFDETPTQVEKVEVSPEEEAEIDSKIDRLRKEGESTTVEICYQKKEQDVQIVVIVSIIDKTKLKHVRRVLVDQLVSDLSKKLSDLDNGDGIILFLKDLIT